MALDNRQLAILGLVGVGAYVAYRYVYLPARLRAILAQQAAAAGLSTDSYVARLGAAGCQALGMYYKIPPSISAGPCSGVGQAVASAPSWLTSIGQSAAASTQAAGLALGVALPAVGSGAGGLVSGVAGGFGSAMNKITDASVYGAKSLGGLVKGGAEGAGHLIKEGVVGASMLPVNVAKSVVGGTASVAKDVGHFFSSIF